jgi:hypothetical protein
MTAGFPREPRPVRDGRKRVRCKRRGRPHEGVELIEAKQYLSGKILLRYRRPTQVPLGDVGPSGVRRFWSAFGPVLSGRGSRIKQKKGLAFPVLAGPG